MLLVLLFLLSLLCHILACRHDPAFIVAIEYGRAKISLSKQKVAWSPRIILIASYFPDPLYKNQAVFCCTFCMPHVRLVRDIFTPLRFVAAHKT